MLHLLKEFVKKCLPPFLQDWLAMSSASRKNKLGRFVRLHRPCRVFCSSVGDYSYIGPNSHVSHVKIGKFCSIGPRFFAGWGIHPVDGISTAPMFYSKGRQNGISLASKDKTIERKSIEIGNDVFIGVNVTVLDGVRIGDGAVIAAGAVVASDVMPYSIVGGVPAKEIRKRFTEDEIAQLLKIKWWDFPDDKLCLVEQHFNDVEAFVNAVSREGR